MKISKSTFTLIVRVLAVIGLLLGLGDAANLLGVGHDQSGPMVHFGVSGFFVLSAFTVATLFAAVGLWIGASWGAVLMAGAMLAQLGMATFSGLGIEISILGYVVRSVLALGALAAIAYVQWEAFDPVHH